MILLIVDDEYYSVENLKNKLDWGALGFEQVLCAYSMQQAQQAFSRHAVDVMLCDIEMPKGSGLELLEWVRTEKLQTVCVFLTCFARFDYASRAIKLESSDYLLKPVETEELEQAVVRAIEKRRQEEARRLNALHAEYWMDSSVQRAERFWKRLADGNIPAEQKQIEKELAALHLPGALAEELLTPVLLDCKKAETALEWEQNLYEYALKNILNEVLFPAQPFAAIVRMAGRQYLIPIPLQSGGRAEVLAACQRAVTACTGALPGAFRFYVASPCTVEKLSEVYTALQTAAREDIGGQSKVCDVALQAATGPGAPPAPLERWSDLLLARKIDEVQNEAVHYLQAIGGSEHASRRDLTVFYHDFSQILYALLDRRGAPAHKLFADASATGIAEQACDSVRDMEAWITTILTAYVESMAATGESGTIIEAVQTYVHQHLAEDLNRNVLAQAVFISPDYLSHLFRDKAGTSLTAYITAERIRRAKELLAENRLSIRDIALASGFQNISYFSKQFKRVTGQTPQEYRKG